MSSCGPNVPSAFQAGGVCGGNGVCVNSTTTAGLLLCRCNTGFSGASDFFDNRVEKLPDGSFLSFSCQESRTGTIVVWVIFMLFGILRAVQLLPMFRQILNKHLSDPARKSKGFFNDFPLRIATFDLFAVTIPFLITAIGKLAGMTLGTDILVTITLALTVLFFNISVNDLTRTEFDIFVRGSVTPEVAIRLKRLRNTLKAFGTLFIVGVIFIPSMWALTLDKSLGPIENLEVIAIYLRSLGTIVYVLIELVTTWMVRTRVRKLLSSQNGGGKNDQGVLYIVNKMDAEMRQYMVFVCTLGTLYAVSVIPYLLQFQTYFIAIGVGLGALRHSAKAFAKDEKLASVTKSLKVAASEEDAKNSKNSKPKSKEDNSSSFTHAFPTLPGSTSQIISNTQ